MPNFNSIGSGVSEPQVAENRCLPLTEGIALTTVYMYALMCYTVMVAVDDQSIQVDSRAKPLAWSESRHRLGADLHSSDMNRVNSGKTAPQTMS